jgi:predicted ATPase
MRQELQILILLGPALMASEGFGSSKVEHVYSKARELCRIVDEAPQLCAVLYGLFSIYSTRAKYKMANEAALEMVRLADKLKDPLLLVLANFAAGQTQVLLGEFPRSRDYFERTASSYSQKRQRELTLLAGFDCGIIAMVWDSLALWMLGYPDRSQSLAEQAVALAQQTGHQHGLVYTLCFLAWIHHFRREWQTTIQGTQTVIALATEHALPLWQLWATTLQGSAMVEMGQTNAGCEQLSRGLEAMRAADARITLTATFGLVAQAHSRAAKPHRGLAAIDESLAAVESSGECFYLAELNRVRGELILIADMSNQAEAERCFRTSIEIARGQNAKSWELRSTISLAHLLANQGKRAQARATLAGIYGWFTDGLNTADLKDARALLDQLAQ